MPLHEYQCRTCQARFERWYRTHDDVPETAGVSCPQCGAAVRRLPGMASLAGRADAGVGRAAWPRSWADTHGGDPEVIRSWGRRIEREIREEEKNPGLAQARQANAIRSYEQRHGPGPAATGAPPHGSGHAHQHGWTAVPFVAPAQQQPRRGQP